MASLLISLSVGGSLGTIIGIFQDPIMNKVLAFSSQALGHLARGDHLSQEEKDFIKQYNDRQPFIINGQEYTQQFRAIEISQGYR